MTMQDKIQMAEVSLNESEIAAAIDVLRSGYLIQGPRTQEFETAFADRVGANHAIAVSSGSAALHVAYEAILNPGDEVLVPTFTHISTASMVHMAGGRPITCEVRRDTFLLDLEDAEQRLTEKTVAIVPVHLFGNLVPSRDILQFAEQYGLDVVWDAAQAHGAKENGREIGGLGGMTCYSFYPSKNMFTGEGGMVTTDNDELAERLRLLRSHGQTEKYLHPLFGFNYRMTDVEASIGRAQLDRLDKMLERRARNAKILNKGLELIRGVEPQAQTPNAAPAWHQYCVVIEKDSYGMDRNELAKRLGERGVSTGVHYPRGIHQQPAMIDRYGPCSLPVAEYLADNILALPVHHGLDDADAERIVETIAELSR